MVEESLELGDLVPQPGAASFGVPPFRFALFPLPVSATPGKDMEVQTSEWPANFTRN